MVPSGVRALGIRIGVGLIEHSLYKHASLPGDTGNEVDRQAAENAEYEQRVQSLLQKALQPQRRSSAVERETRVLSVPQ